MRFEHEVRVAASPEAVRAWWLDVPREWIVGREGDALLLETTFGGLKVRERLVALPGHRWRFDTTAPLGLDVTDEFEARPAPGGAVVRIRLDMRGRNLLGRLALPFYWPVAKRQFRRRWREAAQLCERDVSG